MSDFIIDRMQELRDKAVETAFEQPEQFDREFLERYHQAMLDESKKGLRRLQNGLAHLMNMRDKYINDMKTGELIWFNIELTQDCIKQEMKNIEHFQEELKNARAAKTARG